MATLTATRIEISAEDARKYAGKWVVIKDGRVLFAADDPADVLAWVRTSKVAPDLMVALPEREASAVSLM